MVDRMRWLRLDAPLGAGPGAQPRRAPEGRPARCLARRTDRRAPGRRDARVPSAGTPPRALRSKPPCPRGDARHRDARAGGGRDVRGPAPDSRPGARGSRRALRGVLGAWRRAAGPGHGRASGLRGSLERGPSGRVLRTSGARRQRRLLRGRTGRNRRRDAPRQRRRPYALDDRWRRKAPAAQPGRLRTGERRHERRPRPVRGRGGPRAVRQEGRRALRGRGQSQRPPHARGGRPRVRGGKPRDLRRGPQQPGGPRSAGPGHRGGRRGLRVEAVHRPRDPRSPADRRAGGRRAPRWVPVAEIVYVSCDGPTLGRDLAILEPSYALRSLATFEMFPQTSHVEIVVHLERRRPGGRS